MKILFERTFHKELAEQLNKENKDQVREVIENIESARSLFEITNLEKLKGYKTYFRIRVGSYRIGFELVEIPLLCAHTNIAVRFIEISLS